MKKLIVIALVIFLLGCCQTTVKCTTDFSDTKNHWAENYINRLVLNDVINGYEDGTFKPDNNVTVAEFLKMIVQYTEYKKILEGERWPDWYINTAKYYNFIKENEFENYNEPIKRNEVAEILARYINVSDVKKAKNIFKDNVSDDILRLLELGVITGYDDGTFRGNNLVTRAEASAIICRAVKTRREIVANRKYDLEKSEKLTNINRKPNYKSDYSNRYEVRNGKLYFYDDGRYANLDGYTINEKYITNKKLIKLIESLIQEDGYTAVSYVPDTQLLSKIIVNFGRQEGYVYNNSYAFGYVFYEDKPFELKRISMNENLSEECFMKITIARMWKDFADFKNGEYAHKLNNEKLLKSLQVIFDKEEANEIYEYIQECIPRLMEEGTNKRFAETKKIGKYELNLYTDNIRVVIYVSK